MNDKVNVSCSNGFEERGFHNREAAQKWIDDFDAARTRMPDAGLCDGQHNIVEESNAG